VIARALGYLAAGSLYVVIVGSAVIVTFLAYRHVTGFFNGSCP
jgi:hypothetical protein